MQANRQIRRLKITMIIAVMLFLSVVMLVNVYYDRTIARVRSDVESQNYRDASKKIDFLLELPFMKSDQAFYLKGLCDYSTGKPDEAMASWQKVSSNARFNHEIAIRTGEWLETQGKLAQAEFTYRKGLLKPGGRPQDIRHMLVQLLWLEGRLYECRELVETNWRKRKETNGIDDSNAIANLRALLSLDLEVYPVDHVRNRLTALARKSPADAGILLGIANLYIKSGQYPEAKAALNAISRTKVEELDRAIVASEIQLALHQNNTRAIIEIITKADSIALPPTDAIQIASLLLRNDTDNHQLVNIINEHLTIHPADVWAIDELAELEISAGNKTRASELKLSRATIDQTLRDYSHMVGVDLKSNSLKMSEMSAILGRWFESLAFRGLAARLHPDHPLTPEHAKELDHKIKAARQMIDLKSIVAGINKKQFEKESETNVILKPGSKHPDSERLMIPQFNDIADKSGINHIFQSGKSPNRQLPETMSGGLAMIDYDNDGFQDLFLLQGGIFPHSADTTEMQSGDRLLRNSGNGQFEDVTEKAGLPAVSQAYSHGVTVGDVNNDGFDDLFITRYGSYRLYLNSGTGKFSDVTTEWKLDGNRNWPSSAAFADFDNDGDLDLYVCHYVAWDSDHPRICGNENGGPVSYCVPHVLTAQPDRLYRNDGGYFTDISHAAGITNADVDGRGLGVVTADFDDDGLVDIFVANDGTANFLFKNKGNMQFENVALLAGVAANSDGGFQAGMGVACGDFNNDLKLDLIVTNFYGESTSYFENLGDGLFRERSAGIGLKDATRFRLGFGTVLADFNNDGLLDLMTANGHVNDVRPVIPYQMPTQLLLGQPGGRLFDPGSATGTALQLNQLGRGLVVGDLNNDGFQDAIQLSLDTPVNLFHNSTAPHDNQNQPSARFLTLQLEGRKSNRNGIGTKIIATVGTQKHLLNRSGGGSYQSSSDRRLHLGLGKNAHINNLEIHWPSGQVDRFDNVESNKNYQVIEGDGQLKAISPVGNDNTNHKNEPEK